MHATQDHPLRYALTNELHARPFPALRAPCRAISVAFKQPGPAENRDRALDRAHLISLLDRFGAVHPQPEANHYSGKIGRHELKWEQHTEFVTYTVFMEGLGDRPFDPTDFSVFPEDWLKLAPGQRVTSAMIRVELSQDLNHITRCCENWFVPESTAISSVVDDVAIIAGDFRIDTAGHSRFAVFTTPDAGKRRIGRITQRLCEIEIYKTMSMLGLSRVRKISRRLSEIDLALTGLMSDMAQDRSEPDKILTRLLGLSSELESMAARASFRFSATAAYEAIVSQRIEVLREERIGGRQSFAEFMMRRYDPAMRTVAATDARIKSMSARAIRAGELLRTQVDVERSAQNQALLESMDRRAGLQLRLQKTVEGLSVVAISYYAVSLASYLLYPLAAHFGQSKSMLSAALTLPVVFAIWWGMHRVRAKIEG